MFKLDPRLLTADAEAKSLVSCTSFVPGPREPVYCTDHERSIAAAVAILRRCLCRPGGTARTGLLRMYLRLVMHGGPRQRLDVISVDRAARRRAHRVLFKGTVNHCPWYPREVAKLAAEHGVAGLVLALRTVTDGAVTDQHRRSATGLRAAVEIAGGRLVELYAVGDEGATPLIAGNADTQALSDVLEGPELAVVEDAERLLALYRRPPGPAIKDPDALYATVTHRFAEPTLQVYLLDHELRVTGEVRLGGPALCDQKALQREIVLSALRHCAEGCILIEHVEGDTSGTPLLDDRQRCDVANALRLVNVAVTEMAVRDQASLRSMKFDWTFPLDAM